MGIYGPWNATYSKGNWGTLVDPGTGQMQKWINQHSTQCIAPNIDITNTLLTTSLLNQYAVILILDIFHTQADLTAYYNAKLTTSNVYYKTGNQRPLTTAEVNNFKAWYSSGGKGFMTTIGDGNGPNEAANVNLLLAASGIQYDTVNNSVWGSATIPGSDFRTTCPIAKPLTNQVGKLWVQNGANILYPGLNESSTFSAYVNAGGFTVAAARIFNGSRVNVWGDEWITYDDVWNNYNAGPYWDDVLTWLSPSCPRPPSSLCP